SAVAEREVRYRFFCARARVVVVPSLWGKRDLTQHYDLDPGQVGVIPVPAPTAAYAATPSAAAAGRARRQALPEAYVLYPAQTWEHKNHIRLVEALARLRKERGLVINLVCTGRKNDHFPAIAAAIEQL